MNIIKWSESLKQIECVTSRRKEGQGEAIWTTCAYDTFLVCESSGWCESAMLIYESVCETFDHCYSATFQTVSANRSFRSVVDLVVCIQFCTVFHLMFFVWLVFSLPYRVFCHRRPPLWKWSLCQVKIVNWSVSMIILFLRLPSVRTIHNPILERVNILTRKPKEFKVKCE